MVDNKKTVVCRDRVGKEYKVGVDKLTMRVGVYGILIEDGKVLLSKQWDGYDFPGGGVNIDEMLDEALVREFFEETGLKVKKGEIVACGNSLFKTFFTKRHLNSIQIYYLCERVGGELSIDNIDGKEKEYLGMPEWVKFGDLKKIKFYNSVDSIKIIKKAKEILYGKKTN
ncbi:NUDIX hydrolase [Candidatus Falkowbacteria bacterium]|nr:NUDIX hydrolase [Candidatus Falkowbacteria bacterium]